MHYDLIVIGSGPAGQKAAIQASKLGKKVAVVDVDKQIGGACVHRGTIPSKTLRESALQLSSLKKHAQFFSYELHEDIQIDTLMYNIETVTKAHDGYISAQLKRNHIDMLHGKASFISEKELQISSVSGSKEVLKAEHFLIATGSIPRSPSHVPIDHESIFDTDSLLSMVYLPHSMIILGGGVIASEYASIFANLGVRVKMIDSHERPLGMLDGDLVQKFVEILEGAGSQFIANRKVSKVEWDGISKVKVSLDDGQQHQAEKVLCALGRVANVDTLNLDACGVEINDRGFVAVNNQFQTSNESVYAAGDVIGPPALASSAMEQGRRAVCRMYGIDLALEFSLMPMGIYSVPEISSIGMNEKQAREAHDQIIIGKALFKEVARGQISGHQDGMLKLITCSKGKDILGAQIVGEGATELIHIAQMGIIAKMEVDAFVDNVFNFPTMAEAYRIAALDIMKQR